MATASFEEELQSKVSKNESPVPALPKSLYKKRRPKLFGKALKYSLIVHGTLVGIVIIQSLWNMLLGREAKEDLLKKQGAAARKTIRVDLVDLPDLKVTELKSVDLSQEIAKAPEVPKKPSPQAMALNKDPKPLSKQDRLKEIQDQMRSEAKRKDLMAKLKGEGADEGRQALGGNQVSQGLATEGELAQESDAYMAKVKSHLQKSWDIPSWMNHSKLRARILVKLSARGEVLSKDFLKRSGNAEFDSTVEKAIDRANPFPAPPPLLRAAYQDEGIEWGFPE